MVNFHDPAVESKEGLALLKFWLVVDGIFLWEFFTTLDFEWSIILGRRRHYRWNIWIYSLSRVAALATVITDLVLFDLNTPYHCQVAETFALVFAYLALSAASFVLLLRIVGVWKKNIVAVGVAAAIWAINGAFFIQGASRLRYEWVPLGHFCTPINFQDNNVTIIIAFLTDVFLLIILLIGLCRVDGHRRGGLALGRFLWNQSVIWLLLATVAGVVPTVFACLNLNEPLNTMFLFPWIITMTIAASRMYRSLDGFLASDASRVPYKGGRRFSDLGTRGTAAASIPPDEHTAHSHPLTSQTIRPTSLGHDMDTQLQERPHEPV